MEKIFVSAYACEPDLGSEIGVGWHWVLEMSKYFELWVLTRENNRHTIEPWINNHPNNKIHFLFYDLPKWARFWKKGLRGVRIYYYMWQLCTNNIVKQTMRTNNIRLYHLLTYGNALWPASSYGQSQFFIWGPIGGVDIIPQDFSKFYDWHWRTVEMFRRIIVKSLPLNRGFLQRCRNANLILCKSESMLEAIPWKYRHKAVLFTDVAVEINHYYENKRVRPLNDSLVKYMIVGRLDAWRGFDIAIEAMAIVSKTYNHIHLDVVGDGSDKKRILRWIEQYDIGNYTTLHGQISMNMYYQMMADCDVVLNCCLKEGAVTTAFDSLSFGKPLICIDTGGYTRYFNDNYAIVIPLGKRQDTIMKIANAMVSLTSPTVRKCLGQTALTISSSYSWEAKGKKIYRLITGALHEN